MYGIIFPLQFSFSNQGEESRLLFLIYYVLISLWHDNIRGNDVHIKCVFGGICSDLDCCLWEFINNDTQPVEETGEDDFSQPFPSLSSYRSVITGFENVVFPTGC